MRVTSTGAKSYVFQGRMHGASLRLTIGSPNNWPLKKAQAEARRLRMMLDQGVDPRAVEADKAAKARAVRVEAKRQAATVGDAWAAYLAHHESAGAHATCAITSTFHSPVGSPSGAAVG